MPNRVDNSEKTGFNNPKVMNSIRIVLISIGLIVAGMMLQSSTNILPNVNNINDEGVSEVSLSADNPNIVWKYNDTYTNQTINNMNYIELEFISMESLTYFADFLENVTNWYMNSTNDSTMDNYPEITESIMTSNAETYTVRLYNATDFELLINLPTIESGRFVLSSITYIYNHTNPLDQLKTDYSVISKLGELYSQIVIDGMMDFIFADMLYSENGENSTIAGYANESRQNILEYCEIFGLNFANNDLNITFGDFTIYQEEAECDEYDDYTNFLYGINIIVNEIEYIRYSNGTITEV